MNIRSIEEVLIKNERQLTGHEWSIEALYSSLVELNDKVTQLEKKLKKLEKIEKQ